MWRRAETGVMDKPHFWKTTLAEQQEILGAVKKGKTKTIAKSAGSRDLFLVEYSEKQDFGGTANYSSACGAGSPKYYADKTGKKPVIFLIGAIHAAELEGTSALLNLINMIETGTDFRGYKAPFLSDCANRCRLLIVPIANPDGRARGIPDMVRGLSYEDFRHYGQGRWKDGSLCEWPQCKTVHPIKEHVSFLGSYYNDDGINMMHDYFFGNMANETKALFDTSETEAPDFTILLHGGDNTVNVILDTAYAPLFIKEQIRDLSLRIKAEADTQNLPYRETKIQADDSFPPRSFNLASALHHACGTVSLVYESNQGIDCEKKEGETILSYDEILTQHYILFEQTIRYAIERNAQGGKNNEA